VARVEKVLYLAAHGGFRGQDAPLGGGAAVSEMLLDEWARTRPFEVELISPSILEGAPSGHDLTDWTERRYARFSREFSLAATRRVLAEDPRRTAVLVNDVSEGPDFEALAAAGFRVCTIYHVDVVDYVSRFYAQGWAGPWTLARVWELARRTPLGALARGTAGLVFEQQRASLAHSRAVVVPSPAMKEILENCYPRLAAGKIRVLEWGAPPREQAPPARDLAFPPEALKLLALSRISPEKGQDLLLDALRVWERRPDFPARPVILYLCGAAAFMKGRPHLQRLRERAARLRRVKVQFAGHVTGARKRAYFEAADLYVFPSRHESYGLTLMEALSYGLPAVACDSSGARAALGPGCGILTPAGDAEAFADALARMAGDQTLRRNCAAAARDWAAARPFSLAAAQLAEWIRLL
jgi:glycosyltransferase involved in cell wall biosynthesis